jgi:hypothetical protein
VTATAIAFRADGVIAVGFGSGTVALHDPVAGSPSIAGMRGRIPQVMTIRAHTDPIVGLAFSADARWLVSWTPYGVRLWSEPECIVPLIGRCKPGRGPQLPVVDGPADFRRWIDSLTTAEMLDGRPPR